MYTSPHIAGVINSRRMRYAGDMECSTHVRGEKFIPNFGRKT
jgi:hypothetical protein